MFDRIFADYLLNKGKITAEDSEAIFQKQESSRARLGVIAVSEQLLTIEQANEINNLQSIYDRRFGQIAVDKGFLTDGQVDRLISLQGNRFMSFIQAIVDLGYMTLNDFNLSLADYQQENNFTLMNIEDLKSCKVSRIMPLFLYQHSAFIQNYCGLLVRTVNRLLDYRAYIDRPYVTNKIEFEYLSAQQLEGDHSVLCNFYSSSEDMIEAAKLFAGEKYIHTTDDSLDALCELINCINGMYATELSNSGVFLDMDIPKYYSTSMVLTSDSMICFPIHLDNCTINVALSFDQEFAYK